MIDLNCLENSSSYILKALQFPGLSPGSFWWLLPLLVPLIYSLAGAFLSLGTEASSTFQPV